MPGEGTFIVEGVVIEPLSNGTWRMELSNGHRLLGFVAGKARENFKARAGDRLQLQVSPFDLSEGRILVNKQQI
jgi:translation initiation factor IF-1